MKRRHAAARDEHALARGRAPLDRSAERAEPEVEAALIGEELGLGEHERLVVDVEADDLRVGHVDDGLPDAREAERLFGVPDGPGLVEPVDERAVHVAVTALFDVAAQADVAVADAEHGLGATHVSVPNSVSMSDHSSIGKRLRFSGSLSANLMRAPLRRIERMSRRRVEPRG